MNKPANVVLLVDDEAKIRRFLRAGFELKGYEVLEAERGAEALKIATFRPPDLIILDLILPDLPGVEVLEKIRFWSNAPIIVLSVVSDEQQKVRLLRAGADDYVVKPFSMAEPLARAEVALRRYFKSVAENPVVTAGPLTVNLVTRAVELNKMPIQLTRKEYHLLHSPGDADGFLTYAGTLRTPTIHNAISRAKRLDGVARYGFPESVRRHFERLDVFPRGLLPIADAICRFNPVYGQGMSVAALEACLLRKLLVTAGAEGEMSSRASLIHCLISAAVT